jgi:hypothetical protein
MNQAEKRMCYNLEPRLIITYRKVSGKPQLNITVEPQLNNISVEPKNIKI